MTETQIDQLIGAGDEYDRISTLLADEPVPDPMALPAFPSELVNHLRFVQRKTTANFGGHRLQIGELTHLAADEILHLHGQSRYWWQTADDLESKVRRQTLVIWILLSIASFTAGGLFYKLIM